MNHTFNVIEYRASPRVKEDLKAAMISEITLVAIKITKDSFVREPAL